MAFDLNSGGGDGDISYDSGKPRKSPYAPSYFQGPIPSADTDVSNPPNLSRYAPPPEAPVTTDHLGPQSPLDYMLGKYNESENAYKALLEKGPDQFKPSIWRRLAGFGLGTVAGMSARGGGYGRYSNFSADPRESFNIAHGFTFGPQEKLDADYKRRLEAGRVDSDEAMKNYQLTRQQGADELQQENIRSEMEARNRDQVIEGYRVPQGGGPATAIPITPLPEGLGPNDATNLPEVIQRKEQAPLDAAEARETAREAAAEKGRQETFSQQQLLERQREDAAERRQKSGAELKGKQGLQKVVDDARNIDALEQEQRTILSQVEKPENKGGGKRGILGGGPYLNGPQSMQFLANHMALTVGRIKGARTGKDLIEAHIKARDLDQTTEALAQRILSGGVLTHEQAQQMLGTTGVKRASAWQKVRETGQDLGVETDDYVPTEYGGKRQSQNAPTQQNYTPQNPPPGMTYDPTPRPGAPNGGFVKGKPNAAATRQ